MVDAARLVAWGRELRAVHERHLDGIEAVMESHFRYEERALLSVLDGLSLEADPGQVLDPL